MAFLPGTFFRVVVGALTTFTAGCLLLPVVVTIASHGPRCYVAAATFFSSERERDGLKDSPVIDVAG